MVDNYIALMLNKNSTHQDCIDDERIIILLWEESNM